MKICQVSVDIWIISDVFTFVYLVLKELWRHLLEDMMSRSVYFVQQGAAQPPYTQTYNK